jgi:hypothetical protein
MDAEADTGGDHGESQIEEYVPGFLVSRLRH